MVRTVEEAVDVGARFDGEQPIQMGVDQCKIVVGQPAKRYAALVRYD